MVVHGVNRRRLSIQIQILIILNYNYSKHFIKYLQHRKTFQVKFVQLKEVYIVYNAIDSICKPRLFFINSMNFNLGFMAAGTSIFG